MDLTETCLDSESIVETSFLKISRDSIRLPNGKQSERVVVRHPGAACVLAVTAEDKAVLVRQWRYAVGKPLLELPAGKLDIAGEDPAECALRELAEETPYTAERVKLLHTFYTAPGFCDEKMYLYLAEGVREGSELETDEDEFTETVLMSREEVRAALLNDEIADAKTLIGLQYWLLNDQ
ncbi:ADP-ribose pyrophosphatase [Neisseria arctica]|uniref:GDP-mannose pyrophosphatase n=1 Tax=Neisseria arctica TaxID=1470200 RepID=A0A0J0YQP4_9NEIS|nr:NUDIX hydrolase [Neisseria arctica]KLT72434.1 ADP-ribose pyrophosphatase [Neisseria arctica]UOO85992.1 NUDIX hydrolase [Neisseria arctica]